MSEKSSPLRDRLVAAHMRTAAVSSERPAPSLPTPGPRHESELETAESPPSPPPPPADPAAPPRRGKRQALVLVGVAVVLALAGFALNAATSGTPKAASPTATPVPTPARTARTTVYDRFERTSADSLGKAETGQPWAVVGSKWSTDGHQAAIVADAEGKRSIAFTKGGTDGVVQARFLKVAAGAGLVFRYKDAYDHWELVAAPKYGTWNLQRVVGGQVTTIGNVGTVGTGDGTTIAVRMSGAEISISVGGVEQRVFNDLALADQTMVGFTALAVDGQAVQVDDFAMSALTAVAADPTTSAAPGGAGG